MHFYSSVLEKIILLLFTLVSIYVSGRLNAVNLGISKYSEQSAKDRFHLTTGLLVDPIPCTSAQFMAFTAI